MVLSFSHVLVEPIQQRALLQRQGLDSFRPQGLIRRQFGLNQRQRLLDGLRKDQRTQLGAVDGLLPGRLSPQGCRIGWNGGRGAAGAAAQGQRK